MHSTFFSFLISLCLLSCRPSERDSKVQIKSEDYCTFETINLEYEIAYNSDSTLFSIFGLTLDECAQLRLTNTIKSNRILRENIMAKFVFHLCDSLSFRGNCTVFDRANSKFSYHVNHTIGDFALYCLAKIEPFPLALATGYQNCTEPWISNDVLLPINFTLFGDYRCDYVLKRYRTYFVSEKREYYIKEYGYK